MGCVVAPNKLKSFCFIFLAIICFMVSSCSVSDESASSTSFRPVPYQPVPYQPRYQYRRPYYGAPNSRSHYNPYEFQQPYGSNPYSDYDQYYVPPVQYYNNEFQEEPSGFSGSPR